MALGFNGAALLTVRKQPDAAIRPGRRQLASMEPHFLQCGNRVRKKKEEGTYLASMEPHFLQCGNCCGRRCLGVRFRASMEPHFLQCGNLERGRHPRRLAPRFNGAALLTVRKRSAKRLSRPAQITASMEPHFLQCGNQPASPLNEPVTDSLQWSRTSYSAETGFKRARVTNPTVDRRPEGAVTCELPKPGA